MVCGGVIPVESLYAQPLSQTTGREPGIGSSQPRHTFGCRSLDESLHLRPGRVAELLGGSLVVTSEVGKGSVFSLRVASGPLKGVELIELPSRVGTGRFDLTLEN